jgi:hypothetical protein
MRLVVFCEAAADFRAAQALVDRVLREQGPDWVADLVDVHPEAIRVFAGESPERPFYDVHHMQQHRQDLEKRLGHIIRVPHGGFQGKPGGPMALLGRTIAHLSRAQSNLDPIHAVLIVVDIDDQRERRDGLEQARTEASSWASFRIVLGCPDPAREAWVLAGFVPASDEERARLDALRQTLGFSPCEAPTRLRDKDKGAPRNAKRVLATLTADDATREDRCLHETPLADLRSRGATTSLPEFLDEIARDILPLCTRSGAPSC